MHSNANPKPKYQEDEKGESGHLIRARKLEWANSLNPKGRRTFEWKMPKGQQVTVAYRNGGEQFGGHFHKGEDPDKKPERLLLVSGKIAMILLDAEGRAEGMVHGATSRVPVEIVIPPGFLHYVKAITNCIFIEYRNAQFNPAKSDTYGADEFRDYCDEKKIITLPK